MKKVLQRLGMTMVLSGLVILIACLTINHYKLTQDSLEEAVSDSAHLALLQPALQKMIGKEFISKFSFARNYQAIFDKVNQDQEDAKENTIEDDYTLPLLKSSTDGFVATHNRFLLGLILSLFSLGSMLYSLSKYLQQPPGIKNNIKSHQSETN